MRQNYHRLHGTPQGTPAPLKARSCHEHATRLRPGRWLDNQISGKHFAGHHFAEHFFADRHFADHHFADHHFADHHFANTRGIAPDSANPANSGWLAGVSEKEAWLEHLPGAQGCWLWSRPTPGWIHFPSKLRYAKPYSTRISNPILSGWLP